MSRRWFLLGLLGLPAAWAVRLAARNRLVVSNDSGQVVRSLTISVCEQTIAFGDLPPDVSASAHFGTPSDESRFAVQGRLNDGTRIDDSCGYVVWEDYFREFFLSIRSDGMVDYR